MHLIDHCEPLFGYICRLNRLVRSGQAVDFETVRTELKELLARLAEGAKNQASISEQFRRVELPLLFFVDSVISESGLPFAGKWNQRRLAYERNELAGDEKFFDIVDETLAQPGKEADERLAIYYTCIGLGFTGWYQAQPEYLRKKMKQILARIGAHADADEKTPITPDAYQHTNTSNLPLALGERVLPLILIVAGLLVFVAGFNIYLFRRSSSELSETLTRIVGHERNQNAQAATQP